MDLQKLIPGDPSLIQNLVDCLKAKGIFDEFRRECLEDLDTKSSYQNLCQIVDGYTTNFLSSITWHPGLNKNELRNELRRRIEQSEILERGASNVVDQVIRDNVHHLLSPKISGVVHEYIEEQNDLLNKKSVVTSKENISSSEKTVYSSPDSKSKALISDPIADILSFKHSTSKATPTNSPVKIDGVQLKNTDYPKQEKRKEKTIPKTEKNILEILPKNAIISIDPETLMYPEKENQKIKKKYDDVSQKLSNEVLFKELKPEKSMIDYIKLQNKETCMPVEENKANLTTHRSPISDTKNFDKNMQKLNESNTQNHSSSLSKIKNPKKELNESVDKRVKNKIIKSLKELPSPTKSDNSIKNILEEKSESSKSKFDSRNNKISESSMKNVAKSNFIKKEGCMKNKGHSKNSDKTAQPKSSDKNSKKLHSDSSLDSDIQSSPSSLKKTKQKYQQTKKKNSEYHSTKFRILSDKKGLSDTMEQSPKNYKSEKNSENKMLKMINGQSNVSKEKLLSNSEKYSDSSVNDMDLQIKENHNPPETLSPPPSFSSLFQDSKSSDEEFACNEEISIKSLSDNESALNSSTDKDFYKIFLSSSSSSEFEGFSEASPEKKEKEISPFSSSKKENMKNISQLDESSVSSLSNVLNDNFISNSDAAAPEISLKEKKEQAKGKDSYQNSSNTLPPSPSPSSSYPFLSDPAIHSSSDNEALCSEAKSKNSNNNETALSLSANNRNAIYDIFLCSSSSSEFEGFENYSPEKKKVEDIFQDMLDAESSVSSVHTSDLSSFDDEISDDDFFYNESQSNGRKKLTMKEAQELIQNKADLVKKNGNSSSEKKPVAQFSPNEKVDEEFSPLEPIRSLRRERKPNPRYASSEYASIFNSKKDTFINKKSIPSRKRSDGSIESGTSKE